MKATSEAGTTVYEVYELELHARTSGTDGEVVAFLHGFDSSEGTGLVSRLAEEHRVVAFEHPGFGEAPRPDWAESIDDFAYVYLDWLDSMDEPVHLVGSSLGGWLAAEIAVRCTRAIGSLILINPMGLYLRDEPPTDLFTLEDGDFDRARLHDTSVVPDEGFDRPYRIRNMAMLAMLGWNPRLYTPNLPHRLHRIDVPTLIVWGQDDRVYPPVYGETFASSIPGSTLELVPEAGHLPYEDKPDEVAGLITAFIQEQAARAQRVQGGTGS